MAWRGWACWCCAPVLPSGRATQLSNPHGVEEGDRARLAICRLSKNTENRGKVRAQKTEYKAATSTRTCCGRKMSLELARVALLSDGARRGSAGSKAQAIGRVFRRTRARCAREPHSGPARHTLLESPAGVVDSRRVRHRQDPGSGQSRPRPTGQREDSTGERKGARCTREPRWARARYTQPL
jgi:hypothetical protein